ncbi:hypothetical protein L198_01163 [Cryptococcus wingfieldii CBS 7118]|uniref:Uncharacterized protein n=1 Tax=Cryptococcus wingfieldii CBS 7118 TaxID=1295528 RepID=A0A1E3K437_9TREE|nr:hypothetical protein L198_01163 [Cryptococcus wingfieldii CBS 7118]ODO07583.1 hypothetical protein L198_01163 [Cryptococcus wingfieldii CBS 7118]
MSSTTITLSTRPTSTTKPIAIPSSKSHSQAQTKLRSVPSLDSGYFENNSPPPSPPPTAEERLSVPMLADEAIGLLEKQDAKVGFFPLSCWGAARLSRPHLESAYRTPGSAQVACRVSSHLMA